jgi:hypothetical protein
MDEEEVDDSNNDDDSLSDVGADEDHISKEQATILFHGVIVVDDKSTSEEKEKLEDSNYAQDVLAGL